MNSLKNLLLMGPGPSSSHTIGPYRACLDFLERIKGLPVSCFEVTLYGSFALTGKGHGTDEIIRKTLGLPTFVKFDFKTPVEHPNTVSIKADNNVGATLFEKTYISIGGGSIASDGITIGEKDVYPFSTFTGLKEYMAKEGLTDIFDVIARFEDPDIVDYARLLIKYCYQTITEALEEDGYLPGPLKLKMVAKQIYAKASKTEEPIENFNLTVTSYAYAMAESNARGKMVVTAPTCGSCGVVPAIMYYFNKDAEYDDVTVAKGYLVGALMANFIKHNASVSGAVHGCQAEIGSAAVMATAMLCHINSLSTYQIEYGSEVAMEHFLGLTCDPVQGYVQIPCVERNAIAAIHAMASYMFAKSIGPERHNTVSFDNIIEVMKKTGEALNSDYKETSKGGLATVIGTSC